MDPCEPNPERRRKLEAKSKRPRNRRRSTLSTEDDKAELLSSPRSCEGSDDRSGEEIWRHKTRHRPKDCCCLQDGCCKNDDGCCGGDDFSGSPVCPCHESQMMEAVKERLEVDVCGVCMEDGRLRRCCNRHYCTYCYQSTGNCPGCHLMTVNKTEEIKDGEECRKCLRQGFRRKCCGEFFCSDCYFSSGHCPSCQKLAERRVKYERMPRDPGLVPVLLGYLVTLLVTVAVLACFAVVVVNNKSLPVTLFGQTCYGFFPQCIEDPKCIDFSGNISDGIGPITEWGRCEHETSVNKVYGSYCIYDKQVFVYSREKWGFDLCKNDFLDNYNGVYVFEDTFDMWAGVDFSSAYMASARWDHITNGQLSAACGSPDGKDALYFSGANYREAETLDVDIRYGGKVIFQMKMGPYAADTSTVTCKPAYGGNVYLYSSFDAGTTWNVLTILETWTYRSEAFHKVEVEVAANEGGNNTMRFKWKQENFENAFEHWALDNVQIVSYFPSGWHEGLNFVEQTRGEETTLREIQCCLNSEQCDLSKSRQEETDCSIYDRETSNERALMGAELFVVLAGLVSLARSTYRMGEVFIMQGWEYVLPAFLRKKRPKIFMADDPVPGAQDGSFCLDVDRRWQLRFLVMTCTPLGVCSLYCAALLRNFFLVEDVPLLPDQVHTTLRLKVHVSGLFLLAAGTDVFNVFLLARDVVCVLPVWLPSVEVDLRTSAGWLRVGDEKTYLKDIKDTQMFSRRFCVCLAGGYVVGVFPWCLIALVVKYNYLPYNVSRYTTNILGALVVLRAWLGPEWLLKTGYALEWLLTVNMYKRDDIGNAMAAGKTKHLMVYSSVFGTLLTMGLMQLFNTSFFTLISLAAVGACAFYGMMLSVVQGLPITPKIKLTTIGRRESNNTRLFIRVHRRALCPCDRHLNNCGPMHSRDEIMCIFVRDTLSFSEMLRGDDTVE
ncbi:unnamed protein product [Discosporangium mesarthrocarpum]